MTTCRHSLMRSKNMIPVSMVVARSSSFAYTSAFALGDSASYPLGDQHGILFHHRGYGLKKILCIQIFMVSQIWPINLQRKTLFDSLSANYYLEGIHKAHHSCFLTLYPVHNAILLWWSPCSHIIVFTCRFDIHMHEF